MLLAAQSAVYCKLIVC